MRNRTTPEANTSTFSPLYKKLWISGAIYSYDPLHDLRYYYWLSELIIFLRAKPKSASLRLKELSKRMFSILMSRWVMPLSLRYLIAVISWKKIVLLAYSENFPKLTNLKSYPCYANSSTTTGLIYSICPRNTFAWGKCSIILMMYGQSRPVKISTYWL